MDCMTLFGVSLAPRLSGEKEILVHSVCACARVMKDTNAYLNDVMENTRQLLHS